MNRRLLPIVLFAAIAIASVSITVFACGDKSSSASNASSGNNAVAASNNGACTAAMAAKCTPEMAAACKAKGASAMGQCPHHGSNAAVTAGQTGGNGASMSASSSPSCCAMKGAKTASAAAGADKMGAMASGSCSAHAKGAGFDAMSAGGASCGGKGVSAMAGSMAGHDCAACSDMADCDVELKTIGSQFQVVPLKNGVMYVYTADDARGVRMVQAAISRRAERVNALVTAQNTKLCPDCKQMRGAMASGKLSREVVNVEGGSISLLTSTDPTMVSRLYAMAGLSAKGVKS